MCSGNACAGKQCWAGKHRAGHSVGMGIRVRCARVCVCACVRVCVRMPRMRQFLRRRDVGYIGDVHAPGSSSHLVASIACVWLVVLAQWHEQICNVHFKDILASPTLAIYFVESHPCAVDECMPLLLELSLNLQHSTRAAPECSTPSRLH